MTIISFSATPTTLIETEETLLTINFVLDQPPPPEGITVTLSTDVSQGFTQLSLLDIELQGITGISDASPNGDFSTFDLTITEQSASITAPIFRDTDEEGIVPITFTLDPGEGNTLSSDSSPITVQFVDDPSLVEGEPLSNPIPEEIPRSSIDIELTPVATGLIAPNWGISAPGIDDRLFVSDQNGILWSINLANGEKSVFLDVSDRLVDLGFIGPDSFDERGLLGIAFHPDFAANGWFYTYTSEPANTPADFSTLPEGVDPDHQSVITQWQVSDPTNPNATVDPDSARILMRIDQPQFNHNGGALNFGTDGYLYIALGDGGSADDQDVGHSPQGNGQDPSNVLGSILRIDPLGSNSANGQYGIPESNPFVSDPEIPAETFAFGFRNPFRFSFDRETGELVLADVGQNDVEEVNIVEAGGNYGWSWKEGTFFFNPNGDDPGFVTIADPGVPPGLIDPVLQYDHDEGISVIGGFVYRGEDISALDGKFVFGDYSSIFTNPQGRLFLGDLSTGQIEDATPEDFSYYVLGFAEDANGEVYVLANETGIPFGDTGVILKLESEEERTDLPLVSLHTGPDYLVESEGTVSAHVFNITGGTIPEGGLVVSVNAPSLSEFDLEAINVSEGGEIVAVRSDGFDIRLTDFTVLIDLPVASDGETEGLETASFSLVAGEGYQVNSDFSSGEFGLVDTRDEIPVGTASEPNDTFSLAVDTGLSSENPQVSLSGAIDFDIGNRYLNENGSYTYVDGIEDVDFYKFELKAGDVIYVDAKNGPRGVLDIVQNVFDAEGNILAFDQGDPGPDNIFAVLEDSYLEFEAPEDGTYYLGITGYANGLSNRQVTEPEAAELAYNPFVPGSGDGYSFDAFGYLVLGEYDLNITLNPEVRVDPPGLNRNNNTPPETLDLAQPGEPTVSLSFLSQSFAPLSDEIISQSLVENLPEASLLTFILQTEGEIPEEGIVVTINSNIYLRDYLNSIDLSGPPFSPGSQVIGAVTDETGLETGFQVRIFEPNTFLSFNARTPYYDGPLELETDGPEQASFFLEGGEGYGVASDANQFTTTFYDSLEQVPAPSVIPEVSFSISESQLIESEGTATTLNFSLSEPPPEEGIIVYVSSENQGILPQFQVLDLQTSGGIFPIPDGSFQGFYFKITEQEASITLPVFADPFAEGLQSYSFTLQETPFYTIDPEACEIDFTIADTPDSVLEVSLSGAEVLVESENSVSILTFNLTAQPPSEGITVTVDAPNLGEFDVEAIDITGGEITEVTESGFSLKITDVTATIELPVAEDGEAEGLETATFTLIESTNSTINPQANQAVFSLYDIPEQVPVTEEFKENDTIPEAIDLNLNPENLTATISGRIYQADVDESVVEARDLTEDVDFYSFELQAGDTVNIDIDSIPFELVDGPNGPLYEIAQQQLDSELRLFDAEGNELASVNNTAAPGEEFSRDPYLEFTASEAGTYYVGVSQLGNRNYDPFVKGSGSGWSFPEIGVFFGDYELNVGLIPGDDSEEPVVSLTATPGLVTEEDGTPVTFNFTTIGTIPEEGLIIATTALFNPQFDFQTFDFEDPEQVSGIEYYDFARTPEGEIIDLWKLTQPNAFIKLVAFDDTIAEEDEVYTLSLLPAEDYDLENYTINSDASSASVTVSDGVPNLDDPVIGFSIEPTRLEEGDSLTVTLNVVDGVLPTNGLEVNIASDTFGALGEFAILDADGNFLPTYSGLTGTPEPNGDASGFSAVMTENTATITLEVLDDGPNEGVEQFTFRLLDGEIYGVDPGASEVTLTIDDLDEGRFIGTVGGDEFDAGVSLEGFNGSNDLVFAGAGDDLIDTFSGLGNNRLYGQSGDDMFILGSNNRAFGGEGNDRFFLLGGDNILTGGAGADEFWMAAAEIPETANTITDLELGVDVLGIAGLGIGFEDLTLTQQGATTSIALGEDELAQLLGINASSLSASNFVFA